MKKVILKDGDFSFTKLSVERKRNRDRKRCQKLRQSGLCQHCRQPPVAGKTRCQVCIDRDKERRSKRKASRLCVRYGCLNNQRPGKFTCISCANKAAKKSRVKKQIVLDHYGQKCNCPCGCGVTKFEWLTIDHINNDGAEQRRALKREGKTNSNQYARAIKAGFPNDLQILCMNCNSAKANYGGCNSEGLLLTQ